MTTTPNPTNNPVPVLPTHVVVDQIDGYTFWRGSGGAPFTEETALAFAAHRTADRKAGVPPFRAFRLLEV